MKKRCTNPACRKEFTPGTVCPHCGKAYPRAALSGDKAVILTCSGKYPLRVIRALRRHKPISLLQGKALVDHCPSLADRGLTLQQARVLQEKLQEVGACAKIVPASNVSGSRVYIPRV